MKKNLTQIFQPAYFKIINQQNALSNQNKISKILTYQFCCFD